MRGNYERLSIEAFGAQLIETGDLDPIYIALPKAAENWEELYRWLVAYWCLYDAGSACYLAEHEGDAFWRLLQKAAANVEPSPLGLRWARGRERRHWRGEKAIQSAAELRSLYRWPEDMVRSFVDRAPSYGAITRHAASHQQFGPWIAFKIADTIDRCTKTDVDFTTDDVFMFDTPREAAVLLFEERNGPGGTDKEAIDWSVRRLAVTLGHYLAPPDYDRPVGLQEIETVLCKWKSHRNGHYPVGNDTLEIRHGLKPWTAISDFAARFDHFMPKETNS